MSNKPKTFKDFQTLAYSQPNTVGLDFVNMVEALSKNDKRSFFAATLNASQISRQLIETPKDSYHPLAAVPYLLQDMFDVAHQASGYGAPFTDLLSEPVDESCLLHKHLSSLGACYLGKTQPSEFGVEPAGTNPTYGDAIHSDGRQYLTGGGAGACAAAVKDGYAPLAFALDTYGGVRIPAAFLGLFAFRMEGNRFAEEGVFPIAPSIDSVGFFTRTLQDLNTTIQALYKLSNDAPEDSPKGCYITDISGAVGMQVKSGFVQLCRALGATEDLAVSTKLTYNFKEAKAALYIIVSRELYSIHQYWLEEYHEKYEPHLLQFIESGMNCSPSAAESAHETQRLVRSTLSETFKKYDYIVLPISPEPNPLKEEWSPEMEDEVMHLIAPASLAFGPAIILPFGCLKGRHSAAQVIVNPKKIHLIPSILEKVADFYGQTSASDRPEEIASADEPTS